MSLATLRVSEFIDELSSSSPAPGGGSVAALSACLGTALTAMVCRLTIGKKKYTDVEQEMKDTEGKAIDLQKKQLELMDRDTDAFNAVMGAFGMPKETEDQKKLRHEAIQNATRQATLVPLEVMKWSAAAISLADTVARKGNANARSDAGVSALLISAAAEAAFYNILINLGSLTDAPFVSSTRTDAERLMADVKKQASSIREHVLESIQG